MKAEDVDAALVRAGERLRASLERQVDVDGAFDRLRDSIRARTTPATAVPEPGKRRAPTGEELMRRVSATITRPGPAGPDDSHGTRDSGGRADAVIRMLYEQHAGSLLRFALGLTGGDRRRAEDVVRETLTWACHDTRRLDRPGGSLRPWLMTVARRLATSGPQAIPGHSVLETPDDTGEAVTGALRALHPSDREILIETYFRGRTVTEAAAKLNLPVDAVKSQTQRALRALRTVLEQRHLRR